MFRPSISSTKSAAASGAAANSASPNKHSNTTMTTTTDNHNSNAPASTIREIRSRTTTTSAATTEARQLLVMNRRQAMSMERLNGHSAPPTTTTNGATSSAASHSMNNINNLTSSDKERASSSISGSSNSINGSTASSPSRGSSANNSQGGLNRTASRVSRFRSAKAVFERLSSVNNASIRAASSSDRPAVSERPKGTVASRYAAAAAARGVAGQQNLNNTNNNSASSPRSRMNNNNNNNKSPLRSQDHNPRAPTSVGGTKSTIATSKHEPSQPRPHPRVIATTTRRTTITAIQPTQADKNNRISNAPSTSNNNKSQATNPSVSPKPPPKYLIDKIVFEIARDANKEHDADCTIQDLSNCDISGIPETLDFDKCFQDVEMMTEEEARKLLSRKSVSPATSNFSASSDLQQVNVANEPASESSSQNSQAQVNQAQDAGNKDVDMAPLDDPDTSSSSSSSSNSNNNSNNNNSNNNNNKSSDSLVPSSCQASKFKVRFSDEPVTVYDTHAASDYDRRNDDIDPVAASAEYEIEKSKEREGIRDSGEDEDEDEQATNHQIINDLGAVIEKFNPARSTTFSSTGTYEESQAGSHTARSSLRLTSTCQQPDDSSSHGSSGHGTAATEQDDDSRKEYIQSLEREVSLKRILEQNLRDLQSQYYETVKQLDSYKGDAETKISKLEDNLADLKNRYESQLNELKDSNELVSQQEKQLNDIKESSQLLEKKYHRAKRIIKDMQSREESFTRREQLYQQKLDEIEFELGVLISTIDRTVYEDGLKYFSFTDSQAANCSQQHQTRLDVFGLLKQMLDNFNNNQKTQSAQIKQRIGSMLEQQLASLLAVSNGCASVAGPVVPIPPVVPAAVKSSDQVNNLNNLNNNNNNNNNETRHNQNSYSYASHRLSQPNMPHPIGVGGQPTKIFHGLTPLPMAASLNEPSPPQSVNSYPSSNSLNSLSNNNNLNHLGSVSKLRDLPPLVGGDPSLPAQQVIVPQATSTSENENNNFQSAPPADPQVPYQTNEWHDKPVSEWTTNQVSTWLLALGLDQYISKFEDRNVNGQSLINLDSTVLKGLGVLNSNDRNLLKKKIRELRVEMEKERKIIEKKLKENLKDKSKLPSQQANKQSWKKSLLS